MLTLASAFAFQVLRGEHRALSPGVVVGPGAILMLRQAEADLLLRLEKVSNSADTYQVPPGRSKCEMPIESRDGNEKFILDLNRSGPMGVNFSYQGRCRGNVILARADLTGPPHRNPDGAVIACPHLHVYREGLDDRLA